jgi:hypothetical protein
MDAAVDLDSEVLLVAIEVEDERPNRVLPPKLSAAKLTVTKCRPQQSF